MRVACVEQVELGNIMEWSITSHVLKVEDNGTSREDGWNMKNHCHLTAARHLREKTHPSIFVVTIREGVERGICSAGLKELLKIIKDQIARTKRGSPCIEQRVCNLERCRYEHIVTR